MPVATWHLASEAVRRAGCLAVALNVAEVMPGLRRSCVPSGASRPRLWSDPSAFPMQHDRTPAPRERSLLAPMWLFLGVNLAFLTLMRIGVALWLTSRFHAEGRFLANLAGVLLGGLRMDVQLLSVVAAPGLLVALLLGGRGRVGQAIGTLQRVYYTAWTVLIVSLEACTPSFVLEYDRRPDRLLLEYLVHPREVVGMLLKGYVLELVLLGIVVVGAVLLAWWGVGRMTSSVRRSGVLVRVGWLALVLPILFLGARSSLRHRAANPSSVAFSGDHLLNDMALSSAYSVLYAAYAMKDEADAAQIYGELESEDAVVAEVRAAMVTVPSEAFVDPQHPTLHRFEPMCSRAEPLNLVIILEESLGAQYCEALGGRPITRFLDTLADEAWWFERMYATGTRSVRGIEAVVSGFPPTPARAVVKLGKAQHNFCTIAEVLGNEGYHTQFVYGGEAHFDNMSRFFSNNGFEEVIDEDDLINPRFVGSWGACDDDILDRVHDELSEARDRPLFSLAFSVSNHTPWEYPEGTYVPFGEAGPSSENAVRYADAALGRFFERAKKSEYWSRTLFLVVADRDSGVHGAGLVPVSRFHIPAAICGADITPRRDARIVSQLDLPTTLLSLLGVRAELPMIGRDLLRLPSDAPGRALMQYDENQAYLDGDRVLILQPHKAPTQFQLVGDQLEPVAEVDAGLARRALAHALLASRLYRDRLYSIEPLESGLR